MNSAKELFNLLSSFRDLANTNRSPQEKLFDYCTQFLGSIERWHVDFKQKRNSSIATLEDDDRRNLAKAVSGFSNSGGGILIWGIEDKTLAPKPITEIQAFTSLLLKISPQLTEPSVPDIDGTWLPSNENNTNSGFSIIYIPESSLPPHRVILKDKDVKNHYFIRSGEDFLAASHTQLEDMFGRRPKPKLALKIKPVFKGVVGDSRRFDIIVAIENTGRGIAKFPFLSIKVNNPYFISPHGIDGNGNFGLDILSGPLLSNERKYGASGNFVLHSGITQEVTCIRVEINKHSSLLQTDAVVIDFTIAAEGIELVNGQKVFTGFDLSHIAEKITE